MIYLTFYPQLQLVVFAAAVLLLSTSEQDHFLRKYAIVSSPLLRLFCFGYTFSSSSFRCLFCVPLRLSSALFLICAAFALSAFFFSFSMVPSAAASFSAISSRAFSTSLKSHSIPLSLSLSFFHLCFKFLTQKCVSFSKSTVTDFGSGKFKAVQIFCNFS